MLGLSTPSKGCAHWRAFCRSSTIAKWGDLDETAWEEKLMSSTDSRLTRPLPGLARRPRTSLSHQSRAVRSIATYATTHAAGAFQLSARSSTLGNRHGRADASYQDG
jgi:hypothetical protein